MGEANVLWPRLFVAPTVKGRDTFIDVFATPRQKLSRGLRALLAEGFRGTSAELESGVATALAWQPASLREWHRLLARRSRSFGDVDTFERLLRGRVTFGSRRKSNEHPDWSILWELEGETGYGGGYPPEIGDFLDDFLRRLAEEQPVASVLDIGTGNCAALMRARKFSERFKLVGIDVADQKTPPQSERIEVLRMSADSLKFGDDSFDAALSVNGIEYGDRARAFPELFRALRLGGRAALVMHRPDSPVVAGSATYIEFLEQTEILEALALSWMYLSDRNEGVEQELARRGEKLRDMTVPPQFDGYYRGVLKGIVKALESPPEAAGEARKLIESFETELRWRLQRDRFLVEHMASIPVERGKLASWLENFGFQIEAIEDLHRDFSGRAAVIGWGVRLSKPAVAKTTA